MWLCMIDLLIGTKTLEDLGTIYKYQKPNTLATRRNKVSEVILKHVTKERF